MKQLKVVLVTAVIALLVVVLTLLAFKSIEPQREIKSRINQYKLIKEEQQLIHDIVSLRYETAVIQAKFKPAPQRPAPPIVSPAPLQEKK